LTEPEEELEVVQAQLELYHTLSPRINEGGKDHIPDNKAASTSQSELTVFPLPFILDWVTRVLTEWPVLISAAALPRVGRTLRFGHYEIPHLSRLGTSGMTTWFGSFGAGYLTKVSSAFHFPPCAPP
jgi:hypothetical protein